MTTETVTKVEAPETFSAEQVWQFEQFTAMGYSRELAVELVTNSYSWHEVARLLKNGCPSELAIQIAAPI
jgi:hypothetical protein